MDITLSKVLGYLFGLLAIPVGLLFMFASVIGGGLLVLAGLIALPIVRSQLSKRGGVNISTWAAVGLVVLLTMASTGALTLTAANAIFDGTDNSTETDVSAVSVTANDSEGPASQNLSVVWNARAQSAVDPNPDDGTLYNSDDGEKYLVVRMQITNQGERSVDLTPRLFRFVTGGVEYEYQALFGSGGSLDATVRSGGTYDGWVAYTIPSDTTEGDLIVHQDAYVDERTQVTFEKDESLPINVSD
ncbi:DUF4352 domain-containing protein [Haloarcula laminariae]|uniref:DUF4352 domain-containing protein n=1 Tax=Haloarcula laminariae TaxID=2961577 RepID=UPI002406244B|nr:DUF4352 domain-containing protein [Halomicroarcula sp. FL173]